MKNKRTFTIHKILPAVGTVMCVILIPILLINLTLIAKSCINQTGIPGADHIAVFMQSTPGLIICVFVPMVLLLAYGMLRCRVYEKNRQTDPRILLAELEPLKAEKAEREKTTES